MDRPIGLASPKYRRAKLALTIAVRYARTAVEIGWPSPRNHAPQSGVCPASKRSQATRACSGRRGPVGRRPLKSIVIDVFQLPPASRAWPAMAARSMPAHLLQAVQQLQHHPRAISVRVSAVRCVELEHQEAAAVEPGSLLVQARNRLKKQSGADHENQRECDLAGDEHAADTDAARRQCTVAERRRERTLPGLKDRSHPAQSRRSRCSR